MKKDGIASDRKAEEALEDVDVEGNGESAGESVEAETEANIEVEAKEHA